MKSSLSHVAYLFVLSSALVLSGCSVLTFDGMERAMASSEKRVALLDKTVKYYHRSLYWGDARKASLFLIPDLRASFLQERAERSESEKFVDISVENVQYDEEKKKAVVQSRVKYFRIPSNIVQTRLEEEEWVFDRYDGGWRHNGVKEVEQFGKRPFRKAL